MSAPKTGIQSKLQAASQEIGKDEEKIEMRIRSNITRVKTWMSQSMATQHPIKLLGMAALGALMIAVTGLQFVPSQADDSSSNHPVTSELYVGPAMPLQDIPDDEWMLNSPFQQDFSNGSAAEVRVTPLTGQGIPDDEWMFKSPFQQDFSNGSAAEVRVTPLTGQGIPDDEWIFNAPYHQDFS